ncbi:MAG: hypothetical protein LWX07_08200 [Bacteroidetes bacterium]|nr:hypothetical protein [Bacteroidota bacterium]
MIISIQYYSFLAASAVIYWLIPRQKARNYFLSAASLLFIFYFDKFAGIMAAALSVYTYSFAYLIEKHRDKTVIHKISITGLVLVLAAFKYLGLFSNITARIHEFIYAFPYIKIEFILIPLGISYIVFKHISYLTDIHWKINGRGSFIDFFLYSSLFTIFVAGPIERFSRFKIEAERDNEFSFSLLEVAFTRIVYGVFKKFVVADWLGYFTAPVWANPGEYSFGIKALALLGYSVQIYMDFSAYSDIAIGASKVYGFKIMENFDYPYFKPNISRFWRGWHISLSDWIRDYLFFPMSRAFENRVWQIFFVPLIAMGICGLWHGPAAHFLLWGFCHGFALFVFQVWSAAKRKNPSLAKMSKTKWFGAVSTVFTFLYVTACWLMFK